MTKSGDNIQAMLDATFARIGQCTEAYSPKLSVREVGTVAAVSTGIAKVTGLPSVGYEELLEFPGGVFGIAFNVDANEIGVVLLGDYWQLQAGDEVQPTGRVMDVAVGDGLLGRVIDPLGRPLDGRGQVQVTQRWPIERAAAPIMDRLPVTQPLQTGVKAIDALVPIGRGQIYLYPALFDLGVLPAVDVTKSVSRVGGKAQLAAYRAVAGNLKLAYAQFEELESFARFGARMDDDTRHTIDHGQRIRACLKQPEFSPVSVEGQIAVLLALTEKLFEPVAIEQMNDAEKAVREAASEISDDLRDRLVSGDKLSDQDRDTILELARQAIEKLLSVSNSPANNGTDVSETIS